MILYDDGSAVEDQPACLSALADAWVAAVAAPADPWHSQVVAALMRPVIMEAFAGATVH